MADIKGELSIDGVVVGGGQVHRIPHMSYLTIRRGVLEYIVMATCLLCYRLIG